MGSGCVSATPGRSLAWDDVRGAPPARDGPGGPARRGSAGRRAERAAAPGVHEEGLVEAAAELDHGLAQEGPAIGVRASARTVNTRSRVGRR